MHKIQEGYAEMFRRYPQEIMVTLRFEDGKVNNFQFVYEKTREFVREVAKKHRTQVAGVAVFNCHRHPHLHMLLAGYTQSIRGLSVLDVERIWRHGSAFTKDCRGIGGSNYLALNITPHADDKWDNYFFSKRLLKKAGVAFPTVGTA